MLMRCTGFEQITIDATASGKGFTAAQIVSNVYMARVRVETAPIRFSVDSGTTVTSSVGEYAPQGSIFEVWGTPDLTAFRAIRSTSTSASISVHYFGASA